MPPTSDEELDAKRANLDKLRSQIADAEALRYTNEMKVSNDLIATQLDAEAARLEAELAYAKAAAGVTAVRENNADLIQTVKDDKQAASAELKATQATITGSGA